MATWQFQLNRILPPLSSMIGLLAVGGGIRSILDPQAFSENLGIPISTSTSPALPFVSFVGARNLSSGLTVLTLLYTGQRKAVGTLFMCGVVTALFDARICTQNGAAQGKAVGNAVMGVGFGLVGVGMYWG